MLNTTKTTKRRFATAAAITAMIAAPIAFAAPATASSSDAVEITISASDLTNAQGVMNVYEVFQTEAAAACAVSGHRTLAKRNLERVCTADLIDDFVVDLNDPNVFEIHYNGTVTVE